MATYSEICLSAELVGLLEEVASKQGYETPAFQVSMGSKLGDNYIGIVYRVQVTSKADESLKPLSLIVKCQPPSEERSIDFDTALFFRKETNFYNVVLPAMNKFQREHGIPDSELAPPAPLCYHAGSVLIFEDMMQYDFTMLDRKITLDYHHCVSVLRALGRMHAVSLALKDQHPQIYSDLTADMEEGFIVPNLEPKVQDMFDTSAVTAISKFKERHADMQDIDRYTKTIEQFFEGYYEKLRGYVSAKDAVPYDVINHGDCWTNNFLFKYSEGVAGPERICFLDYQLVRAASPATDVSYFIYHCASMALRDVHYDEFIDIYYDSVRDFINRLGSDADVVFPRAVLNDQLQRFSKYALGVCTFELPLFTGDVVDVGNTASNVEACWQRIGGVFLDMVDRGYAT